MTPLTVNSIPWMPERAWTVARADCAISGLTRSDYSPENVQPNPPCMGPDTVPGDCLPRYVPWREMPRTPDFEGGEGVIVWSRSLGWGFPDNCVPLNPRVIVNVLCDNGFPASGTVDVGVEYVPGVSTGWLYGLPLDGSGTVDAGPYPEGVLGFYLDAATECGNATGQYYPVTALPDDTFIYFQFSPA